MKMKKNQNFFLRRDFDVSERWGRVDFAKEICFYDPASCVCSSQRNGLGVGRGRADGCRWVEWDDTFGLPDGWNTVKSTVGRRGADG